MRSVAAALIVVAGGAVVAGISARRAAVTDGQAEPLAVTVRTAVTTVRESVRRRVRQRADAAVFASSPASAPSGAASATSSAGTSAGAWPGVAPGGPVSPSGTQPTTGQSLRRPAGARGFVPALEGIRGLAAVGVLTTHVAFVTRASSGSPVKRLFGRLDLAVAVFFAKSGFLLWRTHADHARKDKPGTARPTREYLRSRVVRIMPAYAVLVAAAMLLLKQNHVNGPGSWIANLTLTQIYTSNFLVAGLTHAWSLAVEMAYYLAFPLLWTAMKDLRGDTARWRIPAIVAFGASGLLFPMFPWHVLGLLPADVNLQILPPAFTAWFAAGMLLAEVATAPPGTLVRMCRDRVSRWGWWIAGGAALVATTVPGWFTEGFVHPGPIEFAARTGLAGTMAFLVLAPVVLAPEGTRFPILESMPLQKVGTWSYGIFLWHQLVLLAAFPLTRTRLWDRRMGVIWPVTVAGSLVVGAASHRWLEEPARKALERR
ncbi:acyltransferase [Rhodococcus sp. IEGM 1408]|uniref:acyltransferase family protein n=1 Tax=Rhodococcus sp. IEGM 1408 TaxID=3082220 RepID=UPI002952BEE4|nr:acyltransferase [Rhodococcus sp. IEGM 1408]MDV8000233.1 acyltransferase [Rhodococcus sp. IEGM 1408]